VVLATPARPSGFLCITQWQARIVELNIIQHTGKKYPTACELYKEYPQNTLQYYQTAGDFLNTWFFLVKGRWLNVADLFAVSLAYPDLQDMIELVPDLLQLDFLSLRDQSWIMPLKH
jgi:hypothetical protein